jgi:hypothetical protein
LRVIKLKFVDFWPGFNESNNLFLDLLKDYAVVEISNDPEILIYSCYGNKFLKYRCPKIFYTAENVRPNFRECDFAFSFDYDDCGNRNFRLPLYRWRGDLDNLTVKKNPEKIASEKLKFCCMVVSNPYSTERNLFFHMLSRYKKIDSGGKCFNNIGFYVGDKLEYFSQYKFVIAFENSSYPGYATEKIVDAMLANSLPIYWGNPLIGLDFNTNSFINIHQYNSFEQAIKRIIEIDNDKDLYLEYLSQPYFNDNILPSELHFDNIKKIFISVINELVHKGTITNGINKIYAHGRHFKKVIISKILNKPSRYC